MDKEITTYDFYHFLYKQMDRHPELEKLKPSTLNKLSQVVLRILSELGMQKDNILSKITYNNKILEAIALNGDSWYLDVLLLNENEKKEILGK
jgi:Mor family transcriptional regulator